MTLTQIFGIELIVFLFIIMAIVIGISVKEKNESKGNGKRTVRHRADRKTSSSTRKVRVCYPRQRG